jgi:peptidoglycan/xylan/chitin deacetylase (PgdA/CDA1 family)
VTAATWTRWTYERSIDLLLDRRLPHWLPWQAWQRLRFAVPRRMAKTTEIMVALTWDVEHDHRRPMTHGSATAFLQALRQGELLGGVPCTLYVQGTLVPDMADMLAALVGEHEIGLHGHAHEVWGRSRWWQSSLRMVSLHPADQEQRLQAALRLLAEASLPRPRTFRAPYLNATGSTLRLLARYGFTTDSSASTYLGTWPVPRHRCGIWQIPVSALAVPTWGPFWPAVARFPECSLGDLARSSPAAFINRIAGVLGMQRALGCPRPHLVLLGHPWDIEEYVTLLRTDMNNAAWAMARTSLCTLHSLIERLREVYRVRFCTMSELLGQIAA